MITLTSDIGYKDYGIAQLKGKILTILPSETIVDITHEIAPFNYNEAAYVLGNVYHHFPEKTIHIIAIDTEIYKNIHHIIVFFNNHYFICSNNGIISHILQENKADYILEIPHDYSVYNSYNNFEALGIIATEIIKGKKVDQFGVKIDHLKPITIEKPFFAIDKSYCIIKIIFKDNFGNLVFNIKKTQFEDFAKDRNFEINVKSKKITRIVDKFSDIALKSSYSLQNYEGDLLATYTDAGYLQIGLFKSNPELMGSAQSLLGLNYKDTLTINFF